MNKVLIASSANEMRYLVWAAKGETPDADFHRMRMNYLAPLDRAELVAGMKEFAQGCRSSLMMRLSVNLDFFT